MIHSTQNIAQILESVLRRYQNWWWWLFPCLRGFGGRFDDSFPSWVFVCLLLLFFLFDCLFVCLFVCLSRDQLASINSTFLRPGSVHSGLASWDDCGRMFPDELRVSSFSLIGSNTVPGYHPLRLRWVKSVYVFRYSLPPALLAEWLESFKCYCSNTGWNGHQIVTDSTES